MDFHKRHSVSLLSTSNMLDDILIKKLLLTHDPDGRWLDSETMLQAVGSVMFHASTIVASNLSSAFFPILKNDITEIEQLDCPEPLGCIISKISYKIFCNCKCSADGDLNSRILSLFDLIKDYRWDAKVVLVLAAFAARYGEFWQLIQLRPQNTLADSIARIKQLPFNLRPLRPQIKALSLLVKTMMDVAMCIIEFESFLPHQHLELGNEKVTATKSLVYVAVYWIIRSSFACFCQLMDLRTKNKHDQVYSDSTIIAAWELSSLAYRLGSICNILRAQVDLCHQEIERNVQDKLLNLADEVHIDNQKVLNLLFPSKNYLPLKDCSKKVKLGVTKLKDKIVLLLISKSKLLALEELLLLVQQTCDHPLNERFKDSYEIVWIPFPSSGTSWTDAEQSSFEFLSNSLPWYAVWKPRLLSSAVVKYIKDKWNYRDDPVIVTLDSNGTVANCNALDMIMIWGVRAYPFSASKEAELWEDQNLTMQLLLGDINPLLAYWVEKGKNICIYGSENLPWIQQFSDCITKLKQQGLQLETIYVGYSNLTEQIKNIMSSSTEINESSQLSFTKMQLFWIRLASMRRSKIRLGKTPSSDQVLAELSAMLDMNDKKEGWAVIGSCCKEDNIIRLQGMVLMDFLGRFDEWGEDLERFGLVGTARKFLDPNFVVEGPCNHSYMVSSSEGSTQGSVVTCPVCNCPMKKFVVYQP
ncbi:hypothetical protein HN51_030899 [Arachis hypogaea]|uniref:protein SIEVE ELEMENT OCCLUSION C n=1 Tax=Arachis hypogaea TaxID=3818 RepID=UPI000DEC18B8|nr:protein SIEVE ELEMENT OCCLUSION C [Arachis hypogaea]QHO15464.1 Protein SIEVE ELEMENT OCCLUSION C [Arachis hypogaea]